MELKHVIPNMEKMFGNLVYLATRKWFLRVFGEDKSGIVR